MPLTACTPPISRSAQLPNRVGAGRRAARDDAPAAGNCTASRPATRPAVGPVAGFAEKSPDSPGIIELRRARFKSVAPGSGLAVSSPTCDACLLHGLIAIGLLLLILAGQAAWRCLRRRMISTNTSHEYFRRAIRIASRLPQYCCR